MKRFRKIDLRLCGLDAERAVASEMRRLLELVRRVDDRLGRNAADIKAGAAMILAFNDYCIEPKLTRADRRDVTTGPGADDQHFA